MANRSAPVVIDHGKKSAKSIRRLKNGEGKLLQQVHDIVELATTELGDQAAGKTLVPVVLVYKKQSKRGGGNFGLW